jgi:hypothetical protein
LGYVLELAVQDKDRPREPKLESRPIENGLHSVRHVRFGEELRQIRGGATPEVLATPGNAVVGFLRDAGWGNAAAAVRSNTCPPALHYNYLD